MVDWKKEIKLSDLKRRKKDEADAPEAERTPEKTSIWKKEISLRRKATAKPADDAAPTSIWKKEISLKRKPKAEKPAKPEKPKADDDAPTPFWKKEITLGRKQKEPAAQPPVRVSGPVEGVLGNREVPPRDHEVLVEPEAIEEPVVEAEPVAETEPELVEEPAVEAEADAGPEPEPPSSIAAPAAEPPVRDSGPAEDEAIEHEAEAPAKSWTERVAEEETPAYGVFEQVSEPEPEPEPPVAAEPAQAEAEPPASVLPPEPLPGEEPFDPVVAARLGVPAPLAGVHPPVPASELPPLADEPAGKKPLLKREISFGRKPKQAKPPVRDSGPGEGVRGNREVPPATDEAAKKTPLWKKELSFGRGPKAAKEPKEPKERKPKEPKQKLGRQARLPKPARVKREKGVQRHKKLVGLKIGASQIAAARVLNNGAAQLLQVAREPLEPGIVVGGELRDPDALAEALKAFFQKHKLPKRGIRLGIANNRIGVRSFDLDGIQDPKQLTNAIRFRAQEALPIPIEEAVLDFQVLEERVDDEGQTVRRVLLVVAYRDLIDRYVDACRKAGIRLAGIDLEAFALLRALGAPRAADEPVPQAATVAVAVGYDRSTFAVSDGRVCEFTRVLEWGGFSVNVGIARALDVAPSEAEPIKRGLSLVTDAMPEGLTAEQAEAAREAMRRQVSSFARELVSSLQFYQSQPGSLSIAGITLTGGTAHLPGLAEELERIVGVPVRVGDPLARVRVTKKVRSDDQIGSLAVAIGLGIED